MTDVLIFFAIQYFLFFQLTLTIFLHRGIAHRCFTFQPWFSHVCRFILWIHGRLGPNYLQYYAALHRKHHVNSDTIDDPHSPYNGPFLDIIDRNQRTTNYYLTADDVNKYAPDIKPSTDWIETNLYQAYPNLGRVIIALIYLILFGPIGALFYFAISFFFIPFEMIVGNWVYHKVGVRYVKNKKSDKSVNTLPWGILMAGEELHANHHDQPGNPKFSRRWFEFDIAWGVIKFLLFTGVIKLRSNKRQQ